MNLFILNKNAKLAAHDHCDQHVSKMIVEYCQMLSTTHRILDPESPLIKKVYKKTHANHPCTVCIRSNLKHYRFVYELFMHLSEVFEERYEKVHLSWKKLGKILKTAPKNIEDKEWEDPPQAMPEEFRMLNVVDAYRNFYIKSKSRFAQWKYSETPAWYIEGLKKENIDDVISEEHSPENVNVKRIENTKKKTSKKMNHKSTTDYQNKTKRKKM